MSITKHRDNGSLLETITVEVERTMSPPLPLVAVMAFLACCEIIVFFAAVRAQATVLYYLGAIMLIPMCVCSIILICYMGRKWGRGKIAKILGQALDADADTAIEAWGIAYFNVDRAVLEAVEPRIHVLLQAALPTMPPSAALGRPLLRELYNNWNVPERAHLCHVILEYLARYGTSSQFYMLQRSIKRFRGKFDSPEITSRTQDERDRLVQSWQSRIRLTRAE